MVRKAQSGPPPNPIVTGHWQLMLAITLLIMLPVWWLCRQLGQPGWLSLLVLLPVLNVGLLYWRALPTSQSAHKTDRPPPDTRRDRRLSRSLGPPVRQAYCSRARRGPAAVRTRV